MCDEFLAILLILAPILSQFSVACTPQTKRRTDSLEYSFSGREPQLSLELPVVWTSVGSRIAPQQLAFDYGDLSVNYSEWICSSTACEGEVLRRVGK